MYFLVSRPPKTFFIVSPASSAISTKFATGLGAPWAADCAAAKAVKASRIAKISETRVITRKKYVCRGARYILAFDTRQWLLAASSVGDHRLRSGGRGISHFSVSRFHFAEPQHQALSGASGFEEFAERHLNHTEPMRLQPA